MIIWRVFRSSQLVVEFIETLAQVLFFSFVRGWVSRFSKLACLLQSVILVYCVFHSASRFLNQFVLVGQNWHLLVWRFGWSKLAFDYLAF